jgi:hypothetical protein
MNELYMMLDIAQATQGYIPPRQRGLEVRIGCEDSLHAVVNFDDSTFRIWRRDKWGRELGDPYCVQVSSCTIDEMIKGSPTYNRTLDRIVEIVSNIDDYFDGAYPIYPAPKVA